MRDSRDDGFTLMELMVVVVLLGVVGAVFASSIMQAIRVDDRTKQRADAQQSVNLAMERVVKHVRVAAPLVSVTSTQVVVDVYPDQPSGTTLRHRYTFTLAGGSLTQQLQTFSPATSNAAGSTSTRVLADDLDMAASSFTARDRSGVASTAPGDVASVDIALLATTSAKDFSAATTVFLRNYEG